MRVQRAVIWRFWPFVGQQTRKEKCVKVRANFMCCMFIKLTDANISSLLVMPEYLWHYACFAYSKSLEFKICGFSRWSPGMDSKAAASGEGWKEEQSVGGCFNYFFPFSFFTALGSRQFQEETILWISPSYFVLQVLLSLTEVDHQHPVP